jgi:hypothetical protein
MLHVACLFVFLLLPQSNCLLVLPSVSLSVFIYVCILQNLPPEQLTHKCYMLLVCLSFFFYHSLPAYLFISLSHCLFLSLPPSHFPSSHLTLHVACLSVCLSSFLSVYLIVCPSICVTVYMFKCLPLSKIT